MAAARTVGRPRAVRRRVRPPVATVAAMSDVLVRPLTPADRAQWEPLWHAYLAFYETEPDAVVTGTTWARFADPAEPLEALGAFDAAGRLLGFAHTVLHRSTWSVAPHCYLNDLFTVDAARGRGVGRALVAAVRDTARTAGAARVHWLTHETNHRAQALYDQVAERPGFVQYTSTL